MKINGHDVDFDMDMRKDFAKFRKSHALLEKKMKSSKTKSITDADMENFITGCLKREDAEMLLSDGRLSTLTRVFTEFFSNALDQYKDVHNSYNETAELLVDMDKRAMEIMAEYSDIDKKVEGIGVFGGETSVGSADVS